MPLRKKERKKENTRIDIGKKVTKKEKKRKSEIKRRKKHTQVSELFDLIISFHAGLSLTQKQKYEARSENRTHYQWSAISAHKLIHYARRSCRNRRSVLLLTYLGLVWYKTKSIEH